MLIIEQFIYTSANIGGKKGYQIVAKSDGVSDKIISEINPYLYPLGVTSSKFTESCSLLLLENKIAYSKIKNVGIGHDGRNNTIYNHTLIMNVEDFRKILNDTRILEQYYIEDSTLEGELPQLKIEEGSRVKDITIPNKINEHMHKIMHAFFNQKSIALCLLEDIELIQKILSMLPPSMRLISFSTLVVQPSQQPKYRLIGIEKSSKIILNDEFIRIDLEQNNTKDKRILDDSIVYFVDLLNSQDIKKIEEFNKQFEMLSGNDFKTKLTLLFNIKEFEKCVERSDRQDKSNKIMDLLINFEPASVSSIYDKIRKNLSSDVIQKHAVEFDIPQILKDFKMIPIKKDNIENMFNRLSDGVPESRLKLLSKLMDKRKEDFLEHGASLIIDTRNAYYNTIIYRAFVEKDYLHKCIFESLNEKNHTKDYVRRGIFEKMFMLSVKHNHKLVLSILDHDNFILDDMHDSLFFKKLVKDSLNFSIVKIIKTDMLLNISRKIFQKILKPTQITKSSGTTELQNSVLESLLEIAEFLTEILELALENPETNNNMHDDILLLNDEIQQFLKERKINQSYKCSWF